MPSDSSGKDATTGKSLPDHKFVRDDNAERPAGLFSRTELFHPDLGTLDAYLALKALFGKPSTDVDPIKIQWEYGLARNDVLLFVRDWKVNTLSIDVYEPEKDKIRAEAVANELVALLKRTAKRVARSVRKDLVPAGFRITNPYALYYRTATDLMALAEGSDGSVDESSVAEMAASSYALAHRRGTVARAAFFHLVAAVEGLINLIYELRLRPEFRDDRIVDRLLREQVDVRIRLAPAYCEGFLSKTIDHKVPAFKEFHRIVAARNNFVHANLTKRMLSPFVVLDGFTFPDFDDFEERPLSDRLPDLDMTDIRRTKKCVDDLVDHILLQMDPTYREPLKQVLNEPYIGAAFVDGRYVVQPDGD